jgi:hypothetical protein
MKKLVVISILSVLFFSCSKDNSNYIFQKEEVTPRLESAIFPVMTKPAEVVLGTELSTCAPGESVTLFLPYRVVADDVQEATLVISDPETGSVIRELPMTFSTDPSIANISVPEEIQGSSFMFVTVSIENDMIGKAWTVSTHLKGNAQQSDDTINNAFRVE